MASAHQGLGYALDPTVLMQMHFSFAPSAALTSGVQLGVFSHIADGKTTAAEVARAAGATQRGTRMLLDTLTAFELLRKVNGHYELTPIASEYLVRSSPNYMGRMLEHGNQIIEPWLRLTDAIRYGWPEHKVEERRTAENFFPLLVESLHVVNREPARRAAQLLGAGTSHRGMRVVDVACGSGVWGIAIAEAEPEARITAQDFPRLLDVTRKYLKQHGVERQYDFLGGDLKEVDFGKNRFDTAILGNIVHSEGERSSCDLFRRLARALKPGGRIAIVDMVPNDERTGPPFPILFALNMLVHTGEGDTYTLAQYTDWLKNAGFSRVETHDIGLHSPMIVAHKN